MARKKTAGAPGEEPTAPPADDTAETAGDVDVEGMDDPGALRELVRSLQEELSAEKERADSLSEMAQENGDAAIAIRKQLDAVMAARPQGVARADLGDNATTVAVRLCRPPSRAIPGIDARCIKDGRAVIARVTLRDGVDLNLLSQVIHRGIAAEVAE